MELPVDLMKHRIFPIISPWLKRISSVVTCFTIDLNNGYVATERNDIKAVPIKAGRENQPSEDLTKT